MEHLSNGHHTGTRKYTRKKPLVEHERKKRDPAAPRIILDRRVLILGKDIEKIVDFLARFEGLENADYAGIVASAKEIVEQIHRSQKALMGTLKPLPVTLLPVPFNATLAVGDHLVLTNTARETYKNPGFHGELKAIEVAGKYITCEAPNGSICTLPLSCFKRSAL